MPLKTTEEEMQEVSASLAAAKETSADKAATAAVLSEPDGSFALKEQNKQCRSPFFSGKDVIALRPL